MSNLDPQRGRDELLQLLEQRRRAFHQLPYDQQAAINMTRFLTVNETFTLLDHYLTHGHMADETICGFYQGDAA